ncbi:MAG: TolB-like translocation protein, partial [Planctomycetota bacterium]
MDTVQFVHHEHNGRFFGKFPIVCAALALLTISVGASEVRPKLPSPSRSYVGNSLVVTQLPRGMGLEQQAIAGGMLRADYGDGARMVMVLPDRTTKVLSRGFYSACDPEISFDASHILFAGKRKPADNWNIFEMAIDGSAVRQVTNGIGDCRSPGYQATLYTIISDKPWYQLTFV